jgi:hypothetical protein
VVLDKGTSVDLACLHNVATTWRSETATFSAFVTSECFW